MKFDDNTPAGRGSEFLAILFVVFVIPLAGVVHAQPTSLTLPPSVFENALNEEVDAKLQKIPQWQLLSQTYSRTLTSYLAPNVPLIRQQLAQIDTLRASYPDEPKLLVAFFSQASALHAILGDLDASDREIENWHQLRAARGWNQVDFQWRLEISPPHERFVRSTPNLKQKFLARMRGWRGLGVTPGGTHTPESLEALEFVLFHLGGIEERFFLFEELRPLVLASFAKGHPMRALCEARWAFSLRRLGRFHEAREIVDATMAELGPGRPYPNRRLEITLFNEAALVYMGLGEFARAKELTEGLADEIATLNPPGHPEAGYSWARRANALTGLGDVEGAIAAWHKAALTDKGNAHMQLGVLLMQQGRKDEGRKLIESTVNADLVWPGGGWVGATTMVEYWLAKMETIEAERWLNGARVAVRAHSPDSAPQVAYLLLLEARIAAQRGDVAARREKLAEALVMANNGRNELNLIRILFEWAEMAAAESNAHATITSGKNAAYRLQSYRLGAARGEKAELNPIAQNFQTPLQSLITRLIDAGRLPEAEQVLAILNEERYYDFVRSPSRYSARANIALNVVETTLAANLQALAPKSLLLADRIEAAWLTPGAPAAESAVAEATSINAEKIALRDEASQMMAQLDQARLLQSSTRQREWRGQQKKTVPPGTATLTFMASTKNYVARIETTRGVQTIAIAAPRNTINQAVQKMRQALARPDMDARPAARATYDLVFREIDIALRRGGIQRVQVMADDALRYLPYAAMHDGKHYLLNRYVFSSVSVVSAMAASPAMGAPMSASSASPAPTHAVFAASRFDSPKLIAAKLDAMPLPNAANELDRTTAALATRQRDAHTVPSVARYDDFTREQLLAVMQATSRPKIVHIISHFMFEPGAEGYSKLLASDDAVSLREMAQWDWRGVELVTFSACNTGLAAGDSAGENKAGLIGGPHEVVLRGGARQVIASLWMVNDASTAAFMPLLYQGRNHVQPDWAGALTNTQRHFASGAEGNDYAHPHHWAAFVLHTGVTRHE